MKTANGKQRRTRRARRTNAARTDNNDERSAGSRTNGNGEGPQMSSDQLANALGWISVGLGVAQMLAPARVTRMTGIPDNAENNRVMRMIGAREIASGVGILTGSREAMWLKSRIGGDAMDLALLGRAFFSGNARRGRLLATTAIVAGIAAADIASSRASRSRSRQDIHLLFDDSATHVSRSITINRPPEEVYTFWRDFENLPLFMHHVESVTNVSDDITHWIVRAPAGRSVEWDAELTEDRPNELIAWQSLEHADIEHMGAVRFVSAPRGRGTEVHVEISYRAPAGAPGRFIARLFGEEPAQQLRDDLRRLKQVLETGEPILSDGSPQGTGSSLVRQKVASPADSHATE